MAKEEWQKEMENSIAGIATGAKRDDVKAEQLKLKREGKTRKQGNQELASISFLIPKDLKMKFAVKVLKDYKKMTPVIIELIEKYVGE